MKILADTNFLITCIRQKIDFKNLADELFSERIEWIIPIEVEEELKVISERKGERNNDKEAAKLALKLIEGLDKTPLGAKNVDEGIVRYAENNEVVIATLDKDLKKKIHNKILTVRGKKSFEII